VNRRLALAFSTALAAAAALAPLGARAGAQAEEALAPSVATVLSRAISDRPVPQDWEDRPDAHAWIAEMGKRLAARVPDGEERRELLRLNFLAGRKAKSSAAYQTAASYLAAGAKNLTAEAWSAHFDQTYALHLELAECEYLSGRLTEAEALFALLLSHARSTVEKADVYTLVTVLTFGSGQTEYSPVPLDQQNLAPMIAAAFTDLDSRNDASSEVYVNNGTPGQIVATWVSMGHFSQNYGVRSTFQIVVRSSQFAVPSGEGQIGFCYGTVTDGATATAGFGDGLAAVNTGEVAFHNGALSALNNSNCRWYNLGSGGVPITPTGEVRDIPTLSSMGTILLALLLAGAMAVTRRRQD
jgi:hypothetical protein